MNESHVPSIARNAVYTVSAEVVSRVMLFGIVVWLANYLGDERYGALSYAFGLANIFVIIADFGLATYLIKQIARAPEHTAQYVNELLGLKLFLSFITLACLFALQYVVVGVSHTVVIAGGVAILLQNGRMFIEAFFRARQRMNLEAGTKIVVSIVLAFILGILMYRGAVLETLAWGYAAGAAIGVVIALVVLYRCVTPYAPSVSLSRYKSILVASFPFAVSIGFNYLLNYLDSVMLGLFGQTEAVGWYTAAYKPIFFLTALAGMIINAFFPVISHQHAHSPQKVAGTVQRLLHVNMNIAIPLAVGGVLVGPAIIALFYSAEYSPAAVAFQILVCSTAVIYLWAVFGNSLQACDRQNVYVRGFGWGVVFNIILNIILIPRFSLYGAAVATLLTQLFLLVWMFVFFRGIARIHFWSVAWRPFFAAAMMGAMLYPIRHTGIWFSIPVGAVTYLLVLYGLRGISKKDITLFTSVWRNK